MPDGRDITLFGRLKPIDGDLRRFAEELQADLQGDRYFVLYSPGADFAYLARDGSEGPGDD